MSDGDHDRYRDLTAAYVSGALEPPERVEIEAHLGECDRCRQDVIAFAPLPALLGRLDTADLTSHLHAGSSDALVVAVRDDIGRLATSRRRWRWGAGAAAAVALLFGVIVANDDDEPSRRSHGVVLDVETAAPGTSAHVVADERPWGTYVHVAAEDLPDHEAYEVWVVDEAGGWEPAGSWARTDDRAADLGASSRVALADIDRVVVTSVDRSEEILVAR